jgi:hypothetical protein
VCTCVCVCVCVYEYVCELSYVMLSPEVLLYVHVHVLGRPRVSEWPCPRELLNRLCSREMLGLVPGEMLI